MAASRRGFLAGTMALMGARNMSAAPAMQMPKRTLGKTGLKPTVLGFGCMTTSDPTRSPPGTESMWAYTHVPQQVRGDAGPDGVEATARPRSRVARAGVPAR